MKHQYVSWQLAKRFNKKNVAYFPKPFKDAEKRLRQNMDDCFIASYLFGQNHDYTNTFRKFKVAIQKYNWGHKFVNMYYTYSPQLVKFFKKRGILVNKSVKVLFIILAKILKRLT
jgi:hypothetical protein